MERLMSVNDISDWPPELSAKIPILAAAMLPRLSVEAARTYLRDLGVVLSYDEEALVFARCMQEREPELSYGNLTNTQATRWLIIAWVCGAGFGQLADLHSKHRTTIAARMRAMIGPDGHPPRIRDSITFHDLEMLWLLWQEHWRSIPPTDSYEIAAAKIDSLLEMSRQSPHNL